MLRCRRSDTRDTRSGGEAEGKLAAERADGDGDVVLAGGVEAEEVVEGTSADDEHRDAYSFSLQSHIQCIQPHPSSLSLLLKTVRGKLTTTTIITTTTSTPISITMSMSASAWHLHASGCGGGHGGQKEAVLGVGNDDSQGACLTCM